jgi:hypothetical protein
MVHDKELIECKSMSACQEANEILKYAVNFHFVVRAHLSLANQEINLSFFFPLKFGKCNKIIV